MARILVADDEEGVRSYLAEALEREGHAVLRAADGSQAAEILEREGVDLVISDLRMPALDGMALLQKIRAEQPDVEVVMLTAYGSIENAVAAMKAGAFDYLTKPLASPTELRLVVARALERRALLNLRAGTAAQASGFTLTWGAPAMAPVVEALRRVAATQATVLLLGESGTGKEVAARAIHAWSPRASGTFVAV
ncbi:MAG TPA: response regulator, partial [Myxococcaceae bacterium]|nr:response regulator [Myxococcaceae bacterium]